MTKVVRQSWRFLSGQSTVEAAILIPIIFLLLLLLIQPGILLYDRMVMQGAAAEGCRLLATRGAEDGDDVYKAAILRRLGAVPQQDNFHVHSSGCTWEIELEGNEKSASTTVTIKTEIRPLPIFDAGSTLLGLANANGNLEQTVSVRTENYSAWVQSNEQGLDPQAWVDERR